LVPGSSFGAFLASTALMSARDCRKKFLRFFPKGFTDDTYLDWERNYKAQAHARWDEVLNPDGYRALMRAGDHATIANHAVRIESRTNLLFSFEKMALRDAVKSEIGARQFAEGLYAYLYRDGDDERKFARWCAAVAELPRRQTRVLTWPVLTVFPFIALPDRHVFLKPNVTRLAAKHYGVEFEYHSRPAWSTYASLLEFAATVPVSLKLRGGRSKYLLRRLLERRVPRSIVERGKRGFEAPIAEWLRGPLAAMTTELLTDGRLASRGLFEPREVSRLWTEHRTGNRDHRHRLWQLVMLELWFRQFVDEAPARSADAIMEVA
jgi:hypothetical protein